ELRRFMVNYLNDRSLSATVDNILLTSGASRALDLISSAFLTAGDTVLVDEPGYCNFLSSMLGKHIKLIGVPWTTEGPDTNKIEEILKQQKIKFYFTNPWLQNPTGASITLNVAHKLLNLAERYNLTVVEDNASGELLSSSSISLAAFAGLNRVIHVGSFSKSISPAFRVGYIVAEAEILTILMQHKMMTGLTSSFFSEQLVLNVLNQPTYRRHIKLLRSRLAQAQQEFSHFLSEQKWEVFCTPENGYFIYGRPIGEETDSRKLAEEAKKVGLLFAPGYLFHPGHISSTWTRFNVAFCIEKKDILYPFLQKFSTNFKK
ncbi:aminotransferase-like domain-containing protein, partial [Klebsiella pneumoniae]